MSVSNPHRRQATSLQINKVKGGEQKRFYYLSGLFTTRIQNLCLREGIFTLIAFIPFLVTVCYQMFVQNACTRGNKVALVAFV